MAFDEQKYKYMVQQRGNAIRAYARMMNFRSRI